MTNARRALGGFGEDRAATWYVAAGYEIVARNWRCRDGEIDLVVRRAQTLVFCEVKTRSSLAYGAPIEALTPTKQARLRRLAGRFLAESGERAAELRFDVASVIGGRVEVVEDAF